jgi:hypothetical protein
MSLQQLSIRGFHEGLERRIRELGGSPLNKAALKRMRRGAGMAESSGAADTVGDALDSFIGRWSSEDERRLLDSIASCEAVDPDDPAAGSPRV